MGKDNRRWEDFGDREDTTVISDDTIKRTKIRNGENSNYKTPQMNTSARPEPVMIMKDW